MKHEVLTHIININVTHMDIAVEVAVLGAV
jgi:hypothetical protein